MTRATTMPEDVQALPDVLAALGRHGLTVTRGGDAPAGWVRLDLLAACEDLLDAALDRAGAAFGSAAHRSGATWLVGEVAALVAFPVAAAHLHGRVDLSPAPGEVHLPSPHGPRTFAVHLTGATTDGPGPGDVALGITTAVAPLVDAVHLRTGRGRRALWGTVTDTVIAAYLTVGGAGGEHERTVGTVEAVVAAGGPLVGTPNWARLEDGRVVHVRNVCCHWDRAEGGRLCATCPRRRRGC